MRTATDSCHGTRNQTWNLFTNLYSNSNLDSVSRADASFAWECIRKWHTEPRCRCWCTAQMDELPCSLLFASLSVVLPAPCRKFVCAQCKFIFSFFCGSAAHCSALALLYLMSRTHTQSHTHTHTRMGCNCDRDRRKSVSEMSEKCFARCRVSLAAKSNEYKQSVHSGEGQGERAARAARGVFGEHVTCGRDSSWGDCVCPRHTPLPLRSTPATKTVRLFSKVLWFMCCQQVPRAIECALLCTYRYCLYMFRIPFLQPPPSLSYSLLGSFLPSVSECGCDPGAKCKMRLMQQFLLQNRISSGNVVQQCINWWQEIIES